MVTIKQNMISGLKSSLKKLSTDTFEAISLEEQLVHCLSPTDDALLPIVTSYERLILLGQLNWEEFLRNGPSIFMQLSDYINAEGLRVQFMELMMKVSVAASLKTNETQRALFALLDVLIYETWIFLDYRRGKMVAGYNATTKKWLYHNAKVYYADRSFMTIHSPVPFERLTEEQKDELVDRASVDLEAVQRWHTSYGINSPYVNLPISQVLPKRTWVPTTKLDCGLTDLIPDHDTLYDFLPDRTKRMPDRGVKVEIVNSDFLKEVHMFDGVTPWGDDFVYFIIKYVVEGTRMAHMVTSFNLTYGFWGHDEEYLSSDALYIILMAYLTHTVEDFSAKLGVDGAPIWVKKDQITGGSTASQVMLVGPGYEAMPVCEKVDPSGFKEYWGVDLEEESSNLEVNKSDGKETEPA